MPGIGFPAPDFQLPATDDRMVSLGDFAELPALLVVFMCNHCPYVVHIAEGLAKFARDYRPRGLATVGINANDPQRYPADAPQCMAEERIRAGYDFPYLFDASQQGARMYRAACTPDFFLFDGARQLFYRGQFDASRPGNALPVSGADLRAATDALLGGAPAPSEQVPSVGCNIKWRPGNEPDYC